MKWLIALMICKGLIIVSTQAGIHIKDGLIGIKPGGTQNKNKHTGDKTISDSSDDFTNNQS